MEHWGNVRLGEVCEIVREKHNGEPLPYIGMENIESATGRLGIKATPTKVKSATYRFDVSHVLYGRLRPYLNKVFLPNFRGHCSTEIFPIRCKEHLDRRFLFYWLTSDSTASRIGRTSTGARMPRANMNAVLEFDFLLPPLPEQKRIVAILDEAFAAIDTASRNAERNLANARELFESYLQSVFARRGDGWVDMKLKEAVDRDCSLSYGIVQPGHEHPGGLPIVRPTDLVKKLIAADGLKRIDPSLADSYRRTTLRGGDLLLCVRGSTGTVSVASTDLAGANVTRGIVPINFEPALVSQRFGYHLLCSNVVQSQIRAKTYGAALMQINIRDVKVLSLPLPPRHQQETLAVTFDEMQREAERLAFLYRRKMHSLDVLKQGLLHQAFSGQL